MLAEIALPIVAAYGLTTLMFFAPSALDALGDHASYDDRIRSARNALMSWAWPLLIVHSVIHMLRRLREEAKR